MLHQPTDLDHQWIEGVLGRAVLPFERSDPITSNWGSHVRLVVRTKHDSIPLNLHLKIGSTTKFGRSEVDYYTKEFIGLADAPLVRCHYGDADETHYNLLLDDLSATHCDQKTIDPTESYGRALVEAAAKLHAYRWPQVRPDVSLLESAFASGNAGKEALLGAMRQTCTNDECATARRLFEWCPAARQSRLNDPEGITWIHGDINPTNVLAPIQGDGPIFLIDHQPFIESPLKHWLGINDLAYAIVVWWPVETRRKHERMLVEHWHSTLVARGVRNYSLAKAWDDWRLCGMHGIYVPSDWCSKPEDVSGMRWLWEEQLRRVLAFADDHL